MSGTTVTDLIETYRATYDSLNPEQRALVDEARTLASDYVAQFVTRTAELDEQRRRLRDFAATWHAAAGHRYSLDDCTWSTCLDLITGRIRTGDQLKERVSDLPPSPSPARTGVRATSRSADLPPEPSGG